MTMRALVHIVDDDAGVRDSVATLLDSIGIDSARYATAADFLDAPNSMQPGCVLLDLRIPDMSGLELQTLCKDSTRRLPIIFMTGYGDVDVSVQAMHQGATEFLTKPVSAERLLQTVRRAIELDQQSQVEHRRRTQLQARYDLLSTRERQVLEGIVEGYSNKGVAAELNISPKTVERHRSNVMSKMHAQSLAELVRLYVRLYPDTAYAPD